MKYALTFLMVTFLVGVSAYPTDDGTMTELERDFSDFFHLIPMNKLLRVTMMHIQDLEVINALNYLKSEELHNLWYTVEELPDFQQFVLDLEEAGYFIVKELTMLHKFFSMKAYVPPKATSQRFAREAGQGGVAAFVNDLIAILPKKEIHELHEKKLKESPAFAKYSAYLRSDKYTQIVQNLSVQKPVVNFLKQTTEHGIDVMSLWEMRMYLSGFK